MARKSLQDWASIAEIIGAIAIVLSLVYIAIEVRKNTKALQATTRQALGDNDLTFFASAIDTSIVARARDKFARGEELSPLEMSQLIERQQLNFRIFENGYSQFLLGAIEEKEWARYMNVVQINICRYTPAQLMWRTYRDGFEADFRKVVDVTLSTCPKQS